MLHNIGNLVSPTKIANTLKSQGTKVDQKTVDKYLRGLTDSLLLYEAGRYNIKGKQYLTQQSKYYAIDIGLRNVLVRGKDSDCLLYTSVRTRSAYILRSLREQRRQEYV